MYKAASRNRLAFALRQVADQIEKAKIHPVVASRQLYRVLMALATTPDQAVAAMAPFDAGSREEVMKGFKGENPDLSEADLNQIADKWEENKDVVKDKH